MLKGKVEKEKPFFSFIEKGSLLSKSAESSVTTRGAGSQVPMVLGQQKGKKKIYFCYVYGKQGHIVKKMLLEW